MKIYRVIVSCDCLEMAIEIRDEINQKTGYITWIQEAESKDKEMERSDHTLCA